FVRPGGERVMRTVADYRQLNDALFHAGTNSGSQFEWRDDANRLQFYVIDRRADASGVLSYVVGVRSLDGAGPQARGVKLDSPRGMGIGPDVAHPMQAFEITVTNTGAAPAAAPAGHTRGPVGAFASDIYRVTATI